jgi:hypothetical protein
MSSRRFHLSGLFAVLLALMAQLGAGASVPRIDPVAGVETLCHDIGGAPSQVPSHHPADCPVCPLCVALHAPPAALAAVIAVPAPRAIVVAVKTELPPPSTAPPAPHRPPSQPRAPPIFS